MEKESYFVHKSSYVDEDVQIGAGTRIWHFCHIQSGARIGKNCSIGQNVNISNNVHIGNNVKIQNNVSVYEGVELEDGVFCGPSCVFTNDLTPRAEYPKGRENYKKTLVKRGASIGANATVVCGCTIGEYAMVAAGAVVVDDVPAYKLAAGVPAKIRGSIDRKGNRADISGGAGSNCLSFFCSMGICAKMPFRACMEVSEMDFQTRFREGQYNGKSRCLAYFA